MAQQALGEDSLVGRALGHYLLVEKIGKGGMGVVYRARDEHLKRDVAIKVLPIGLLADVTALQRFRKEAHALSELNHPNIATIHDFDTCDGIDYLVEELIPGVSIDEMLEAGALDERECVDLGMQLCTGLAAVHERGIIHRDIKPGNIRVTPEGHLKILDFGLAKSFQIPTLPREEAATLSETQSVVGTFPYMSPEQLTDKKLDARTDIWSAGAVLYEMATGRRAFPGSGATLVQEILSQAPPPPCRLNHKLSPGLETIILKCMEKDPGLRYQSAREIAVDLKRLATPSSAIQIAPKKRRALWVSLSLLIAVLAAMTVALMWRTQKAKALTEKDTVVLGDVANTTGDPVFTETLRQGLLVKLSESPFLNILPDDKVQATLKQMGRQPIEALTDAVTREVCERNQSKAFISGSIARLGSQYVLGVKALNCLTGSVLAQQQTEVSKKEDVLDSLGKQAVLLRNKLGESLASVQKFDTPLEEATTSSLEALQAYSLGVARVSTMDFASAVPLFQRAIDLDPDFAMAYARLAATFQSQGKDKEAAEYDEKAFALRHKATDSERLYIEGSHYTRTGEMDKAIQVYQLRKSVYPQDVISYSRLGYLYSLVGQPEKSLQEAREAYRRTPNSFNCHNLAIDYVRFGMLDEASNLIAEAKQQHFTFENLDDFSYTIAFLRNDSLGMQQIVDRVKRPPAEKWIVGDEAATEAYHGRLRRSRELFRRAIDMAEREGENETAGFFFASAAWIESAYGFPTEARQNAYQALLRNPHWGLLYDIALAYARAGDTNEAGKLANDLAKQHPKNVMVNELQVPTIRATVEISRNSPLQAIEMLRSAEPYELSQMATLTPAYARGQAYLMLHQGSEAAAEFQKIVDHPGVVQMFEIGALAHLGLARAYVLQGDTGKARAKYEYFLSLWKDADPDIPIYQQAKTEYAKLQ